MGNVELTSEEKRELEKRKLLIWYISNDLISKTKFSILTSENVIQFIRDNGIEREVSWFFPLIFKILFGNNGNTLSSVLFKKELAKETINLEEKIREFNTFKIKLFERIQELVSLFEDDKNSVWILPDEIIKIRNCLISISKIVNTLASLFIKIVRMNLGDFLYWKQIKDAIDDFKKVEFNLLKTICDDFYRIIQDWLLFHELEINNIIISLAKRNDLWNNFIEIQSKRLELHIKDIESIIGTTKDNRFMRTD